MSSPADNPAFQADYERLRDVSLNPARHTARNAHEHCELVRERAVALASANHCSEEETAMLVDLAYVHDIGKITGSANPIKSVDLLQTYHIEDDHFTNLVKYHDVNLSWYNAFTRGQPPSDKAWKKICRRLKMDLLCLFMVADRVDCPGGWIANRPLVWFLDEVKKRALLDRDLILTVGETAD